ncbi:MAG TPA: hypothetical protein VFW65_00885 [Pseudonocardiaceae bacterium]|nr:hypothetical protein [Pseudonocardiaceae bacterium]
MFVDLAPEDQYSPKESVVESISFVLTDDGRLRNQAGPGALLVEAPELLNPRERDTVDRDA